jgi:hypothetical protein
MLASRRHNSRDEISTPLQLWELKILYLTHYFYADITGHGQLVDNFNVLNEFSGKQKSQTI